jgi:cytochrome P450
MDIPMGAQLARKGMVLAFGVLLDRLRHPRFQAGRNSVRNSPNIPPLGALELQIEFDA